MKGSIKWLLRRRRVAFRYLDSDTLARITVSGLVCVAYVRMRVHLGAYVYTRAGTVCSKSTAGTMDGSEDGSMASR